LNIFVFVLTVLAMKLQLGLLYRDNRQASADDLATILGEYETKPAETSGNVIGGPLAMAYRGDRISHEEDNEIQPCQQGTCTLTFDGRLDNRLEWGKRLDLTSTQSIPDPVLIAHAYQVFGESIFADLIGEFALSVWREDTRTLLFARSVCGARPLYYVIENDRLLWCNDFEHLVRVSGIVPAVNDDYALEYLVSQPSSQHTPLTQVHVVPPGTLLRFQENGFRPAVALWNYTASTVLHYRRDEEYEEHCREMLKEAVQVRLRAKPPKFSELSGGFDSSALVLLADRDLESSNLPGSPLKTVSCVYQESESCNESYFLRAVEESRGISGFHVSENEQNVTLGLRHIRFTGLPNPLHCFPGRYQAFTDFMRQHNARLLLTGLGGDHLFWNSTDGAPVVADQICRFDLVNMHKECRNWSQATCLPYFQLLFHRAIPLAFRSLGWGRARYMAPQIPLWLGTKHKDQARSRVWDLIAANDGSGLPSQRAQRRLVESLFALLSAGYFNEYRELYLTHPYTHRPLVEFCLSVPLSQMVRDGETRSLMRRSLRHILPVRLLKRYGKTSLDETLARALAKEWQDVGDVSHWQLCQRGLAEPGLLRESLERMRHGIALGDEPLIRVFSLERWLRSLDCVRAKATSVTGPTHFPRTPDASVLTN
jgi:asparagine synthase (glutamine-hydrolysing)